MSHPSQGFGHTPGGGHDSMQQQAYAPYSQQHVVQQQNTARNEYIYGQGRVDASQYRDQFSTTPLPAAGLHSQLQHQSWQHNNNLYQDQFFSAQTSPHYTQGTNNPTRASTLHSGHSAASAWIQPAQHHLHHAQTFGVKHPAGPYSSVNVSEPHIFNGNYSTQQNRSLQPSGPPPNIQYQHHHTGNAPATTPPYGSLPSAMNAPQQNSRPTLQPQSVNQQPRQTQPQLLKQPHIPPKLPSSTQEETHQPKRRKSNDGTPLPQRPLASTAQQVPRSKTISSSARPTQPSITQKNDAELSTVLLALADEYVTAAYSLSADSDGTQQYHQLIATAIACLSSALTNFRQTDVRREANIRLKLAILIFEETETTDQAEDILAKGIASCERARLSDLRYTMQHLHIQMLHSKIPKAALKAVDKMIDEVEVQKITHWSFAFRYLKFSLSLEDAAIDATALLRQLTQINELSKAHGRVALSCFTSCLETIVSLRSNTEESLELAQRSLADVRSYQLNPELEKLPQLQAMICHLDLACHIAHFSADKMKVVIHTMQEAQENASRARGWQDDGSYVIPLGIKGGEDLTLNAPGIFAATKTGGVGLKFRWITKGAMLTTGYVLSGMSLLPRNGETHKSETFFREAIKINAVESVPHGSLPAVQDAREQQQSTQATIKFIMACSFAARAKFSEAVAMLKEFNQEKSRHGLLSDVDRARLKFMTASCLQGSGELRKALELYSQWLHDFDPDKKTLPLLKDIHVLAIVNSVHIMRITQPDWRERTDSLLKSIETYCLEHTNKSFASVYHIIESTTAPPDTLIGDVKKTLNHALIPAQAIKNKQLLALIMNMMSETFFTDLVGAQAKSSSNAGRTLAKQSGDELWVAVGSGMLRDTLERSGQLEEAMEANAQASSAIDTLPRAVKASLGLG